MKCYHCQSPLKEIDSNDAWIRFACSCLTETNYYSTFQDFHNNSLITEGILIKINSDLFQFRNNFAPYPGQQSLFPYDWKPLGAHINRLLPPTSNSTFWNLSHIIHLPNTIPINISSLPNMITTLITFS